MSNPQTLRVVNWNSRSVANKKMEFFDFLDRFNIDVGIVTETWLRPTSSIFHPTYNCVRFDRPPGENERGGGVLIAVRRGIKFVTMDISTKSMECAGISIPTENGPNVHFIAAYFAGMKTPFDWSDYRTDLRNIMRSNEPLFVVGDFNARHRQWNCLKANKAGTILRSVASQCNFYIHYPDTFTFHPTGRGRPSTLDLVLSNNLIGMTKPTTQNELSSDHLPVTFDVRLDAEPTESVPTFRCYQRADWRRFQRVVDSKIDLLHPTYATLHSEADVDRAIDNFTQTLLEAESVAVPSVIARGYDAPSISDNTRLLIALRNRRRRQWIRTRDPLYKQILQSLNSRITEECNQIRFRKFRETLQTLEHGSNQMWKITKALRNTCKYSPPLLDNATLVASPALKAKVLADSFAKFHTNSMVSDPTTVENVTRSSEYIDQAVPEPDTSYIIRPKDVKKHIRNLKIKKAPGEDQIRNVLLKHLPRKGVIVLAKLFSACLKICYFPSRWKHAVVIAIPKPNKDATLPSNYRPISLLSCLSKLLERFILARIEAHLSTASIIPNQQFGFKKGHSTCHQLVRLVKQVRSNFTQGKSSGMILLDVEKAYDSVWQEAILHKMVQGNFPMSTMKIVRSFLKERSFHVAVDGEVSDRKQIPFGVPQGAVLSPILYNIFTADLVMIDHVQYYLFADDTGFVVSHRDPTVVVDKLQQAQQALESYQQQWKIRINPNKTQAIFFTRKRSPRNLPQREIRANGQSIPWSEAVQYLGATLDQKMNFSQHISNSLKKCDKLTKTLYPMVNRRSALDRRTKLLLYKTVFRPTLTYAFQAWHTCAQTHRMKIQRKQNRLLKMIMDLEFLHPTDDLHQQAGIELIEDWFHRLLPKFILGCRTSDNPLLLDLAE